MSHPLLNLRDGPVARLRMNRPQLHNAFDAELIAALIARLRVSPEGQEGLSAFLDKRKPAWCG